MKPRLIFVLAAAATMLACADGPTPEVKTARRAPGSLADVRFSIVDRTSERGSVPREAQSTETQAFGLMLDELTRAGYQVVEAGSRATRSRRTSPPTPDDDSADVRIEASFTFTRHESIVQLRRGNKVIGGYDVHASLTASLDSAPFAGAQRDFRVTLDEMQPEDIALLVGAFNASDRMAALGPLIHQRRVARSSAERETYAAALATRRNQWLTHVVHSCDTPKVATDCDALREWLGQARSDADFGDEARRILIAAEPTLAPLRDEADWTGASVGGCLEQATDAACAGVGSYHRLHTNGAHDAQAMVALQAVETKSLRRAEERDQQEAAVRARDAAVRASANEQQRRAAEVQRSAQDRAACRSACGDKCASVLQQAAFKACLNTCVSRCQ